MTYGTGSQPDSMTYGTGSLFWSVGRGQRVQSSFGAKTLQRDKQTGLEAPDA